ncbi:MAG: protein kinase [Planctomycetota bacterium]
MNQPPGPGDRTPSDNIPAPPPPRTLRHSARTRALQARDTAAAASGSSASHDALNLSALHTQIHPAPGGVHAAINKYRFAGELGRGGLGVVRLAEDTLLRREVAVKLVLDASNPQDTSAMVEEAQITGQLEHPNIVPVHELGTDAAGRPYMAMKRIQGRTLQQAIDATDGLVRDAIARPSPERLAEAQRSERQLLDAFIKVCDALAYAHSRRVIHRDLKPANVMVGEYGEVLVVDWGLARPIGGDARTHTVRVDRREQGTNLTLQGEVFGTPAYMPPEQASGNAADLDERSDVYSLGAILFTMLTGSAPFSGNVGQILERVARGQVPLPSKRSRGRDVPRELEAVVMTAMAADPADRYQSVVELKADVEAWLDGRRLAAADYSPWQLLGKWMRRHKAIVLTAGASAAALIVVVVLFILGLQSERDRADAEAATARDAEHAAAIERDHARTERDRAVAAEEESRTQAEAARVARSEAEASALRATDEAARAKAAEVDARRQLADSLIAQGDSLLISDRVPDAEERYRSARRILAEQHDPTFAADLALGNRYAVAPPELLTIHVPEAIMATGFCVDGLSLWCACLDGSLRVYDAATGVELRHAMHNGGIASACAVPDTGGTSLVATGGGDRVVRIWDTTTGREVQSLGSGLHTGYIAALAASADGRWIASGGSEGDNTIWIHDRQGRVASRKLVLGDFHAKTTSHARAVRSLAFSPDGTRLVSGSVDTSARVWDLQTDKALITLRPPGQSHVNTVAWTADGKRIITGGIDRMLHIWDAAAPTDPAQPGYDNLLHVAAHRGWVMCSAVTPDSRHILSGSRDHSLRLIDLATGESVRQFIGHDDSVNAVGLSGDGRLAVSGGLDGTLRVWTTSLGATRSEWSRPTNIARMVLSRDGRLCVTTSVDGRLDVRDVETGVRIYYQQAHNDQL